MEIGTRGSASLMGSRPSRTLNMFLISSMAPGSSNWKDRLSSKRDSDASPDDNLHHRAAVMDGFASSPP